MPKGATMESAANWREIYDGGSPEAEEEIFLNLAQQMLAIQESNRVRAHLAYPYRTLHARQLVGIQDAELIIDADLPNRFAVGHFMAGARLPVTLRFSSASALPQPDSFPDMRGAALKISVTGGAVHDLLMTSFPVSHARNAKQFVEFAVIASSDRTTLVERVVNAFGEVEAKRMLGNIQHGARQCVSLALERFWSRGAILWGTFPVRFDLRPTGAATSTDPADDLHAEFAARLGSADVRFRLALQPYVDEERTPIEDGAIEWREDDSRPIEIATLVIPRQDLLDEDALEIANEVDALAFNPWNAPSAFRPLGQLNRARKVVYGSSAQRWQKRTGG
jgi:hypothetical protein